jgi:transposase
MTKYIEAFKLSVVERYLQGTLGYGGVGQVFGIDAKMVRRWVAAYRIHGMAGLKKKFTHYSAEFKLSVLHDKWANHLSNSDVSAKYDIRHAGAVGQWERCYHHGGIDALHARQRGRPKKMPPSQPPTPQEPASDTMRTQADLLAELAYLRMENAYLKKRQALVQSQQQQQTTQRKKRK